MSDALNDTMGPATGDSMTIRAGQPGKIFGTISDPYGNALIIKDPMHYVLSCTARTPGQSPSRYETSSLPAGTDGLFAATTALKGMNEGYNGGKKGFSAFIKGLAAAVNEWNERPTNDGIRPPSLPPTGIIQQVISSNDPSPLLAACNTRKANPQR